MSKEITGALFKQMILHGAAAITAQKQAINDLNVFPVPDGDTGTNMSMTIATAAEALRKAAPASVGQASSVTASALLQGARGNSGVILSLLFRGLSKALKGRHLRIIRLVPVKLPADSKGTGTKRDDGCFRPFHLLSSVSPNAQRYDAN